MQIFHVILNAMNEVNAVKNPVWWKKGSLGEGAAERSEAEGDRA